MAEIYLVTPFEEAVIATLKNAGLGDAMVDAAARHPTPMEVVEAAKRIDGVSADITWPSRGNDWAMTIDLKEMRGDAWATLRIEHALNLDAPTLIYFKGWKEAFEPLLRLLAPVTGPLAVFPSSGDTPMLFTGR